MERIVALLIFCTILGLIVYALIRSDKRKLTLQHLSDHLNELIDISNLKESIQEPYITSKVIPINRFVHLECTDPSQTSSRTINTEVYNSLPKKLRASDLSEIGTIVWLDWDEKLVGEYEGGLRACISTCTLTIVDKSISAIIHKKTFREDPPESVEELGGVIYGLPIWFLRISEYIKCLPIKYA